MFIDRQMTNQYFSFIKSSGYQYSKDDLGIYFDNGKNKFSIMKNGHIFQCYFNQKNTNGWTLKDKSNSFFNFIEALQWVLTTIQKNK